MLRTVAVLLVLIAGLFVRETPAAADEPKSLLQTVRDWQYPGSTLTDAEASDAATVDARGDRTVESTISRTMMTTEAPVEKVLDFYREKLANAKRPGGKPEIPAAAGRSVIFSDDSDGRPFALHTILVNTKETATTIVVSRGKDEARTHIAWKQYRRYQER